MKIIKWFIEKIKNAVQVYRDNRSRGQIEKWYSANEVTDEQLHQEAEENEREYRRQCKEEDERLDKQMQEIVEDQRFERQIREWEAQEESENRFDNEKDERNDCPADVDEMTLINRQCAAFDEEEEPPSPEVEYWFTRCPKCNHYPEFCHCHPEEE